MSGPNFPLPTGTPTWVLIVCILGAATIAALGQCSRDQPVDVQARRIAQLAEESEKQRGEIKTRDDTIRSLESKVGELTIALIESTRRTEETVARVSELEREWKKSKTELDALHVQNIEGWLLSARSFFVLAVFFFIVASVLTEWRSALSALPALLHRGATDRPLGQAPPLARREGLTAYVLQDLVRPLIKIGRAMPAILNGAVVLLLCALLVLLANGTPVTIS